MDAILTALVNAAPQLGTVGVLLVLFALYIRSAVQDRADYRAALQKATEIHDAEVAELKADISELRKQLDNVQAALDLEREARRKAEDDAAAAMRRRGPRNGG